MYESHFRLRELPFNITPDPRFFYTNRSCREAFATLCYGIEQRKGIVLVTGEAGTGKTTLLKLFMQTAAPQVRASCILDPHLTFAELLECALNGFGLSQAGENRFALIQTLKEYLIQQQTYHHQVALLLDEAQELDDRVLEELRLISDLEHGGDKLLQLVLVGQPELESRIGQEKFRQLRERITLRSRVMPLNADEIAPYIDFRLRAAGYTGKSIFRVAALQRIAFFSNGIPRLINVICDNALLIAYATAQETIGAETIDEIAEDLQLAGRGSGELQVAGSGTPGMTYEETPVDGAETMREIAGQQIAPSLWRLTDLSYLLAQGAMVFERLAGARTKRFIEQWWLEMSAVMATAIVVLLAGIYFTQPDASVSLSPVTKGIEQMQEIVAPLPGRIYRNLAAGSLWESAFNEPPLPTPVYEAKRQGIYRSSNEKKPPAGRTDAAKAARTNRPSEQQERLASVEPKRSASTEQQKSEPRQSQLAGRSFAVVENSYVRDAPTSKAEVIATLRPGTHIQVVGRIGEYFRVRSLDNEAIRGYVHKEDAFFEPYHRSHNPSS